MEDGRFTVHGWTPPTRPPADGWNSLFNVYVSDSSTPILGAYAIETGKLVFRPRFTLSPGVHARAEFRTADRPAIHATFDIPKRAPLTLTRVVQVYPTVDIIPENQLKFYIEFSAPMTKGQAWRHIHLNDSNGQAVDLPFLEVDQELWDNEFKRLTVLFDPGRIKRGVLPLEEVGPAIDQGKGYRLVIDAAWEDSNGQPLEQVFYKTFRVGDADRLSPDPVSWRFRIPAAGTTESLVVDFPEVLDHGLLRRLIQITCNNAALTGKISVGEREMQWMYTPSGPWQHGPHQLLVDTALEDLAGNRIGRLFDVDNVSDRITKPERRTIKIPFQIR